MARKTKEPKKLKIERDGKKFNCSWKCGEEYDEGVQFYSVVAGSKKMNNIPRNFNGVSFLYRNKIEDKSPTKKLAKKADHSSFSVNYSKYYPSTKTYLEHVLFGVRGNRKKHKENKKDVNPEWSDWVEDIFWIDPPKQMKMGTPSYGGEYYSTFSYTIPTEAKNRPIKDFEWQACLVKGNDTPNWDKPDKKGVRKKSAASSFVITEDKYNGRDINWNEPNYSYTRYVRIRARGAGGPGSWSKPVKHVYTMSKRSVGVKAKLTENSYGPGYLCAITWTVDTSKSKVTDAVLIYYTFAIPDQDMKCPDDAQWEEIPSNPIKDTKGLDRYSFTIQNSPPLDHVMFVRVDATHDSKTTYGYPTYVDGSYIRGLTPPVFGSVTPDVTTHRVALENLQNLSEVPNSFLGVSFRDGYESGDGKLVGIVTDTTIPNTIQLPEWGNKGFALGLQAIAGAVATPSTTDPTKYKEETISKMIPTDTHRLSYTLDKTPINGTTIQLHYTALTYEGSPYTHDMGYGPLFIGGQQSVRDYGPDPMLMTDDAMRIEYDGVKSFLILLRNQSGEEIVTPIMVDSVSYTYRTSEDDYIPIYYELSTSNDAKNSGIGIMRSKIEWSGDIPLPPSNLNVAQDGVNAILATWDWNWKEANIAEISWANHEDAWESTDEPQTYTIENVKASRWKIANLEPGNWYVKVRLIKTSEDADVYGTYATANPFPIKVSSAPSTPSLTLLPDTITVDGNTTASWAYEANDGTSQAEAELFEVTTDIQGNPIYTPLSPPVKTTSAQFITIYAETQGWKEGETHNLAVRVKSTVDELSEDYSGAKGVSIVEKPICTITSTSLVTRERVIDSGTEEDPTQVTEVIPNVLADLPLRVTVTGAGAGGRTFLTVVRDGSYHGERPDGTTFDGFDGEVVASLSHTGEGEFVIEKTDRSGYFDDGGLYKIKATVKDSNGQVANNEDDVIFSTYELSSDTEIDLDTEYYVYDESEDAYTKIDPYVLTTDVTVQSGTTYYEYDPNTGTYSAIESPDPSANPSDEGWYILIGSNPSLEGWYVNHSYDNFIVLWDNQAIMPEAEVEVEPDEEVVFITPRIYGLTTDTEVVEGVEYFAYDEDESEYVKVEPEPGDNPLSNGWYVYTNAPEGDTCDIYRLSADRPELIVSGGAFNTKYVDPYPTYGQFGGHRIVYVTKNGDYTVGELEAIKDFREEDGDILNNSNGNIKYFKTVIDFANEKVELPYDLSVSLKWAKDVSVNKYLDGSVTADWNPAIDTTSTINTTAYVEAEPDTMLALRRLAMWPGYCHVRTPDGSSFTADVQVNIDHEEKLINRLAKVSLSITRVDNYGYDGMTYDEWIADRETGG